MPQPEIALQARHFYALSTSTTVRECGLFPQKCIWRSTSNMSHLTLKARYGIISSTFLIAVLIITGIMNYALPTAQQAHADPTQRLFNHFLATHYNDDGQYDDNSGPAQEQYYDRTYPHSAISYNQSINAYNAFQAVSRQPMVTQGQSWHLVGPTTGTVPGAVTYTGRGTVVSGRIENVHSINADIWR